VGGSAVVGSSVVSQLGDCDNSGSGCRGLVGVLVREAVNQSLDLGVGQSGVGECYSGGSSGNRNGAGEVASAKGCGLAVAVCKIASSAVDV